MGSSPRQNSSRKLFSTRLNYSGQSYTHSEELFYLFMGMEGVL